MNSLIFFVIIIGIDIFLKSIKDKKKIEESRLKKIQELRNENQVKTVKEPETRVKRNIAGNPSLSKKDKDDNFFGQGELYREDHEGYRNRYEKRYEEISQGYNDKSNAYDDLKNYSFEDAFYDEHAIETRKKEYKDLDVRNYGKEKEQIDIPVPTSSTFKDNVLNGIIFSEILGKPKSMQKRDI